MFVACGIWCLNTISHRRQTYHINLVGSYIVGFKLAEFMLETNYPSETPGGGTPYIRMIGMIVVFFRDCNRRFGIF